MSHSRVMADLSERMWDLADFIIITMGGTQQLCDAVHDRNYDHELIRTAIRSQNPLVARAATESHIIETPGELLTPEAAAEQWR